MSRDATHAWNPGQYLKFGGRVVAFQNMGVGGFPNVQFAGDGRQDLVIVRRRGDRVRAHEGFELAHKRPGGVPNQHVRGLGVIAGHLHRQHAARRQMPHQTGKQFGVIVEPVQGCVGIKNVGGA